MSSEQNGGGMGEQITGALAKALQTGDFTDLNGLVSQTVTDALSDAGKHIAQSISNSAHTAANTDGHNTSRQYREQSQNEQEWQRRQKEQSQKRQEKQLKYQEQLQKQREKQQLQKQQLQKQQEQRSKQKEQLQKQQQASLPPAVRFRQIGNVSNVLYQVFGGIGLGVSSLLAVVRVPGLFLGTATFAGWLINGLFFTASIAMIRFGVSQRDRLERARRYIQLCGGRMYVQLEKLSRETGSSIRYLAKDIRKMLKLGMFPEGHLDDQKTCFMLNDAVHRQYLEAKNSLMLRESEENSSRQRKENTAKSGSQASDPVGTQESELNTMIAEGMECIRKLRELNDKIPGEVISEKLYRLEKLLNDIFDSVREHPEQMHRMHKLMDYYLPTTLKLVEAYEDFDKISMPGEEILAAKAEIERTLDIINEAFGELLSNLFQDAVFDATTDAQVLKTMLAREGLTRNTEFKNI